MPFLHIDMDAFFAAVEQRDNPAYQNNPLIVGGAAGVRGVVSTCSYEARIFGVRSAMSLTEAGKRCPHGIFIRGDMAKYRAVSAQLEVLLQRFTPHVQMLSIDEARLDMQGMQRIWPNLDLCGHAVKTTIADQLKLPCTVGVASNGYLAKLVCNSAKPNGVAWLKVYDEADFMLKLSLSDLYSIGPSTLQNLNKHRIFTVTQLQNTPLDRLASYVGNTKAHALSLIAYGRDPYNKSSHQSNHSISRDRTFTEDTHQLVHLKAVLLDLSHELFQEMMDQCLISTTVSLKLRTARFKTAQKQSTHAQPFTSSTALYQETLRLLAMLHKTEHSIRLVGLTLQNLQKKSTNKELFLAEEADLKQATIEQAVLNLKKKGVTITKASVLGLK